jgi:hypothetical protein
LTPPLGLNLFILGFRFERSLPSVYRAVIPFTLLLVALGLVSYVPQLSTWSSRLVQAVSLGATPVERASPGGTGRGDDTSAGPGRGAETLEDLMGTTAGPAPSAETIEDLLDPGGAPAPSGETLEDLLDPGGTPAPGGETLEGLLGPGDKASGPPAKSTNRDHSLRRLGGTNPLYCQYKPVGWDTAPCDAQASHHPLTHSV